MDDVILRPVHEADLDDLCRYFSDPEAGGVFEWTGFKDPKAMRRRWEEEAAGMLGAILAADAEPVRIGSV